MPTWWPWAVVIALAAFLVIMLGVEAFYAVRLWWWRRTGRGTCKWCGARLVAMITPWLRRPYGFFQTCRHCGRDQRERAY